MGWKMLVGDFPLHMGDRQTLTQALQKKIGWTDGTTQTTDWAISKNSTDRNDKINRLGEEISENINNYDQ